MSERDFERTGGRTVHEGRIATLRVERFRYADGTEVEREVVHHPGAVGIVVVDGHSLVLVRQPREAVGEPDMLELPAGRLDHDDESPLETAKRELAEEIGKAADRWEPLTSFYTSVGILDERVHLFFATGLHDAPADSGEDERIEIVHWPLADFDRLVDECEDAKTLIGVLLARHRGLI
jgi:8-oxo-dGTP pyrophosphatase MutT (NUDIX family)